MTTTHGIHRYKLYTYDVWGNARDGFQVNDVYPQSGIYTIRDDATDYQINRKVSGRGITWDGEPGYTLYAENKRNGKPVGELRCIDEVQS